MARAPRLLRFALSPSLGAGRTSQNTERLLEFFTAQLPELKVEVVATESYPALGQALLSGKADAAWAPPLVCARVEAHGGKAIARTVRGGVGSYRAALICRRDRPVDPAKLLDLTAAWVDRDSTAGYLLPQAWVRGRGVDPFQVFTRERFFGSFRAAAEEVAEGRADLSATHASPQRASRAFSGLDELPAALQKQLKIFAFTAETPSDAVVVGPGVAEASWRDLQRKLLTASSDPAGRKLLKQVFDAESFELAPPDGYRVLYNLVLATLR